MERIDEIDKWLESHSEKASIASYEKYIGIKDWDMNRFDEERRERLLEPGLLEHSQKIAESSADPVERRKGEVLSKLILRAYIDLNPDVYRRRNGIEEILMKFRPNVGGREMGRTEVRELMRKEEDRDVRREAYLCDNPLGELLKDEGKRLFLRRNELARKLGFENYPECILSLLGIPLTRLLSIFKKTKEKTEKYYRDFLESARKELRVKEIMPWDIPYILQKIASLPDKYFPRDNLIFSLKKTLKGFGKDFNALNIKIKFTDIPYGGLCFGIKIPADMRILLNPRDGHRWYSTIFHEFGHAIHGASIRQDSFLLKGSEGPFSEGMADVWGGLPSLPEWLESFTSIPHPEIERFMKSRIADLIYGIRSIMVWSNFEIEAYKNPDSDLDEVWNRLMREYLLIGSEGKLWASNYFILTYPVYAQNYLLSPMIREQVYASLRRKFGGILGSPDVLDYITENLYADGCLFPWTEKIEKATEKPFGPDDLIRAIESSS
ncbi:MAG: hypothetical protein U9R01_01865 [candidate division WOR-3 bacterium]|nr:hypothetical protein [candidate division WOR-3 bacterium]